MECRASVGSLPTSFPAMFASQGSGALASIGDPFHDTRLPRPTHRASGEGATGKSRLHPRGRYAARP
jgi:hypothetical protein